MVTSVISLANGNVPAVAAQGPQLSDVAQNALEGLGRMHADFDASAQAMQVQASKKPAAGPLAGELQAVQQSFQTALKVQHQIMQFSMATSISQSLGNNLNSFLKGA